MLAHRRVDKAENVSYIGGSLVWKIPVQYKVNGNSACTWRLIANVTQLLQVDADGKATVAKDTVSGDAALNEPAVTTY